MTKLYLLSGGYGAGKTYFCHRMVGISNTVALATDIKSDLFKIFKDTRFHSTKQEDKDSLVSEEDLLRVIKKERVKDIPISIFRKFTTALAELKDLRTLSVKNVMQIYGGCGRSLNKHYWVNRTIERLAECKGDIAVDDVRFVNEFGQLNKWALKNNIDVVVLWAGVPDAEYNNLILRDMAEYTITWEK